MHNLRHEAAPASEKLRKQGILSGKAGIDEKVEFAENAQQGVRGDIAANRYRSDLAVIPSSEAMIRLGAY